MTGTKHFLSVCSVVRDEGLYLEEWLDFHQSEGIEHFFMFDNLSQDRTAEILKSRSNVTYIPAPYPVRAQMKCYDRFIQGFANQTEWVAFLDADEFLYSRISRSVPTLLKLISEDTYGASAVLVHWLLFGSSNHLEYTPDPVIKRFTHRASEVNPHIKTIAKASKLLGVNDAHSFIIDGEVVDAVGNRRKDRTSLYHDGTADILAINHYHTKSKEEYKKKCSRKRADNGQYRDFESNWACHDRNDVEDLFLFKQMGYDRYVDHADG